MKHLRLILVTVCLTGFFLSCSDSEPSGNDPNGQDSTAVVDSSDSEPEIELTPAHNLEECLELGPKQFCMNGFSFIKLGDSVTWKNIQAEGATAKDTVFEQKAIMEDGDDLVIDWNARILSFEDGRIYLETDFDNDVTLNRIRIETPQFSDARGLKVGSTLKDIKAAYGNLLAYPLPDFGVIEVLADNHVIFHVKDNGYFPEGTEEFDINKIPDTTPIKAIVIM